MNRDLSATWTYHDGTKHSYQSIRPGGHSLDWQNRPLPFKIYRSLEPIALPSELSRSGVAALKAVASAGAVAGRASVPNLALLAGLLYYSAGITKKKRYPGGEILFRAASCTGALYHIDLYVICGDLPDLGAGVYHFGVHDFALRRLRRGDFRREVVRLTGGDTSVAAAPVIVACASTYWRNAWKYQARTYRHCFWDSGTILANLLVVAAAHGLAARVIMCFVDAGLSRLLGLDDRREGTMSLVALGRMPDLAAGAPPATEPLFLETEPLSQREVDYPAICQMHAASSLETPEEAASWRGGTPDGPPPEPTGQLFRLRPLLEDEAPNTDTIEDVIRRRGSTREFAVEPITFGQLSTALHCATPGVDADFLEPPGVALNDLYLIVNAIEGLPNGAYVYRRDREALELLRAGNFRAEAGYLGLEQALPAAASADVFFLTDLPRVLHRFGNRGYRAAQLEAGIVGGKLYLAAYAQRLGATGLTFYDDDVTAFFSPHAAGKSVMFLVALGKPARRRSS